MNVSKKVMIGVAVAAMAAAVLIGVSLKKGGADIEAGSPDTLKARTRARSSESVQEKSADVPTSPNTNPRPERPSRKEGGALHAAAPKQARGIAAAASTEETSEERIKLVETWENFVDKVAEHEGSPTKERALQFKREFDKLDKADQLDGIQTSLNLLPDEQFPLLYPILFDKTVDPDILDAIFSDGLNHDEEIKIPMMKEIYKDKTHPMYEEAERILDATGELDDDGPDGTDGDE